MLVVSKEEARSCEHVRRRYCGRWVMKTSHTKGNHKAKKVEEKLTFPLDQWGLATLSIPSGRCQKFSESNFPDSWAGHMLLQ